MNTQMHPVITVSDLLEMASRQRPDTEAICDRSRRITYRQLQQDVDRLAAALVHMGIHKGDRVGVSLPNWLETIVIYFAVAKIGAVLVPFNTRYRSHEIEFICKNAKIKLLFISEEFAINVGIDFVKPLVKQTVTVRFEREELPSFLDLFQHGMDTSAMESSPSNADDVFCILYTSGTTGFPKGAMLTHQNVLYTSRITAEGLHCSSHDVFLVPVPLFHVFGIISCLLTAVTCQGKLVLQEQYKAQEALELIQLEKVTVHHGVPTMFILELNHPRFETYDLSSLRTGIIAAAPCPIETVRQIRGKMGLNICVSYGATETAAALTLTSFTDSEELIVETVGRAVSGAEIRVVNDQREPVPDGEIGEIACRSLGVMKGYLDAPEQTSQVLDLDGWYYTGDLGTMDAKGFIRIVGRMKEMIIRGGYNIYPREIEEVLYQHPKIIEAAVVGLPDSVLGEIVCAAVRLREGCEATDEEIKLYIREKLADYKVPNQILFVREFPLTASGKIQKMMFKDELVSKHNVELR